MKVFLTNRTNVHASYVVFFIVFLCFFRSFLANFLSTQVFMEQIQMQKCLFNPTASNEPSCQNLHRNLIRNSSLPTRVRQNSTLQNSSDAATSLQKQTQQKLAQRNTVRRPKQSAREKVMTKNAAKQRKAKSEDVVIDGKVKRKHSANQQNAILKAVTKPRKAIPKNIVKPRKPIRKKITQQKKPKQKLTLQLKKERQDRIMKNREEKNKRIMWKINEMRKWRVKKGGRNILFLHIGKSGGATIAAQLRDGCHTVKCLDKRQNGIQNETQISLLTTRYIHCKRPNKRTMSETTTYLISLRNPITRFLSWFIQFHPLNTATDIVTERTSEVLKSFFENCFGYQNPSTIIDDFVNQGLSKNGSLIGWGSKPWSFDLNGKDYSCSQYSRELVRGERPSKEINHMFWNIQFYTKNTIFNPNPPRGQSWTQHAKDKEVLVVRQEEMWEDWQEANYFVGGGKIVIPEHSITHIANNGTKEMLPVYNKTISRHGLQYNLCCTLLDEIHAYRETLYRALNINETEKERSMIEIYSMCNVSNHTQLFNRCETSRSI